MEQGYEVPQVVGGCGKEQGKEATLEELDELQQGVSGHIRVLLPPPARQGRRTGKWHDSSEERSVKPAVQQAKTRTTVLLPVHM